MVICDGENITKQNSPSEMDSKKYIIVKNHVRELPTLESFIKKVEDPAEGLLKSNTKSKKKRKTKYTELSLVASDTPSSSSQEIDPSDLEELRTVYNNCKAVINKIETKYGHLLKLDADETTNKKRKNTDVEQCSCKVNKKIIFDEYGNETALETPLPDHICHLKSKQGLSEHEGKHRNQEKVAIEYADMDEPLPEDLVALAEILRNPNLENNFRNKVIQKFTSMRLELTNEIRFNRPSLVEQLKANPDDVLDFAGTNLADLEGYKI